MLLGYARAPVLFGRVAPFAALCFTVLTILVLIGNLERPGRFMRIMFRPNPSSWLVWGTWILIIFSITVLFWLATGLLSAEDLLAQVLWPGIISSALAAGYSAFLLAQARARDLWRSPQLFPHLIVQAFLAGSALLSLGALYERSGAVLALLLRCVLAGLIAHGILVLIEMAFPRGGDGAGAVHYLIHGPLAERFWFAAVFGGIAAPIYLLAYYFARADSGSAVPLLAAVVSLLGVLAYDDCYMRAGQALPLS